MRILWVTPQLPSRRSGDQVRQYYLLRALCQQHCVTILTLVKKAEVGDLDILRDWGAEIISELYEVPPPLTGWRNRFRSWAQLAVDPRPNYARTYPLKGLRKRLSEYLVSHQPDIVHFEHPLTMPLADLATGLHCVLSEQNIEYHNWNRQASCAKKLTHRIWGVIEGKKLKQWELRQVRRSSGVIVVSNSDARRLENVVPPSRIFIVPNGVDTTEFAPPSGANVKRQGLLFFGTLGYPPNVEALLYFCHRILPLIRLAIPEIRLAIVGGNASQEIVALGNLPGVQYIGYVDNLRTLLWQTELTIVPLRSGGGTRLKILESLAAEAPVVSTSIGAEGLDLSPGREIEIQDSPEQFAAAVVHLLENPVRRQSLAESGRRAVSAKYDWNIIAPRLEEAYMQTLHQPNVDHRRYPIL